MIGLGLVVVAMIVGVIVSYTAGGGYGRIFLEAGGYNLQPEDLGPEQLSQVMGPMMGVLGASLVGLVGWVVSIVATVRSAGRRWGIAGIVVGVLAPIAMYLVAVAGAVAVIQG